MFVLSRIGIAFLAFLLVAPAMQVRFGLSFLVVYYIPIGVFAFTVLVGNVRDPSGAFSRVKQSLLFVLLFSAGLFAYMVGELQETEILIIFARNCLIGVVAVLYPWTEKDLKWFLTAVAMVGGFIALNTVLFFNNDAALALATEDQKSGYLTVTMAMGLGCVAALFLVVDKFTLFRLGLFGVCWFGTALGRGRGAFLFAVLVSLVYLVIVLFARVATFSRSKKIAMCLFVAVGTPFVIGALTAFTVSEGRWSRLIFNFGAEVSEGGRGSIYAYSFNLWTQSPLFGNGLAVDMGDMTSAHNMFLQVAADGGVISLAIFCAFLWIVLQRGYRAFANADPQLVNMTIACMLMFGFILLNLLKSGDLYQQREFFILAMLPIVSRRLALGKLLMRQNMLSLREAARRRAWRRARNIAQARALEAQQEQSAEFDDYVDAVYSGEAGAAEPVWGAASEAPGHFHDTASHSSNHDLPMLYQQPDVHLDLEPESTLFQQPDLQLEPALEPAPSAVGNGSAAADSDVDITLGPMAAADLVKANVLESQSPKADVPGSDVPRADIPRADIRRVEVPGDDVIKDDVLGNGLSGASGLDLVLDDDEPAVASAEAGEPSASRPSDDTDRGDDESRPSQPTPQPFRPRTVPGRNATSKFVSRS